MRRPAKRSVRSVLGCPAMQSILETQGNACTVCSACHLGSWHTRVMKFMSYYTRRPTESMRPPCPPTSTEAEEADRAALAEVFNLCFDGTSLDDGLNHVVLERDLLRHLLLLQPKTQKQPTAPKKRNVEIVPHVPAPLPPLRDNKRGSGDKLCAGERHTCVSVQACLCSMRQRRSCAKDRRQ